MPIMPVKFIEALTKTIDNTVFQLQTKGDKNGKIDPFVVSKLTALSATLKNLPNKLSQVSGVNEATYQKEIHRIMAEAYIDAYRSGRKQVSGKLGASTTAKDTLTTSLEKIIPNALDVAKSEGATKADNFLIPANFNPKEKFEKQFLKNITDPAVVQSTLYSTLTALNQAALDKNFRDKQLEIAINGMKVAVRFSPEGMQEWNKLAAQVGLNSELGIAFDKKSQPKEASENTIKNKLANLIPKDIYAENVTPDSLKKINAIYIYLETTAHEIRTATKPLTTPTERTPSDSGSRNDVYDVYSDEIKTPVNSSPSSSPRASVNNSTIPEPPPLTANTSIPAPPGPPSPPLVTASRTEEKETKKTGLSSPDFTEELINKRAAFFNKNKDDKKEDKKSKSDPPPDLFDTVRAKMQERNKYISLEDDSDDDKDDTWDDDSTPPSPRNR